MNPLTTKIVEAIKSISEDKGNQLCTCDLCIGDLTAAIDKVLEGEGWISVEDRLPTEQNQWILGWHDGLKRPFPCSFNKQNKFIDADGFEEEVTHWQPLPAPPK